MLIFLTALVLTVLVVPTELVHTALIFLTGIFLTVPMVLAESTHALVILAEVVLFVNEFLLSELVLTALRLLTQLGRNCAGVSC